MFKSVRLTAEEQFAATQKKEVIARNEQQQLQRENVEHVMKLRALRLAKVVADKKAAGTAATKKAKASITTQDQTA
jgi:hypothetical protein